MCIFCQIVNGDIPSYKVYEDEDFLAILDIAQTTYGHTLVLPKKHYDTILDMPENEAAKLFVLTQKLAKQITSSLNANGCNFLVNTNPIAGQAIMHAHFHIIPRYTEDDTVKFEFKENKYDFNEILENINKAA